MLSSDLAGDADEGQLPEEAAPAEPAQPAGPSGGADDQSAAPQTAPGGGGANGHAQQLHPPQASGHSGAADEDPDELDLYGDMAGADTEARPAQLNANAVITMTAPPSRAST